MSLWIYWWNTLQTLRPACARYQTFLWMTLVLVAFSIRQDQAGVTSFIRALGLAPFYYDRLLDFFHSPSLCLKTLVRLWLTLLLQSRWVLRFNGRLVIVGDGLKAPKTGRRMPSVKKLHQTSGSNTKPDYIFGHSLQALAILMGNPDHPLAVPLISRISEGVVFSNRERSTLLDKMLQLVDELCLEEPFYILADTYYAARKIIHGVGSRFGHLVSRVKLNAVAYHSPKPMKKKKRGRPALFGKKIKLRTLFDAPMTQAKSPVYGESKISLRHHCQDLLWRPAQCLVRFVAVIHPIRGQILLFSTDLSLSPLEIIQLYGWRFKIEFSFKQAIHSVGVYAYHFWMAQMDKLKRKSGNQYLHHKSQSYRIAVKRKISAYHRFIQCGLIAQGLLQLISLHMPKTVWNYFGSWIRTQRPLTPPTETVTATAMRNSLGCFLADCPKSHPLKLFLSQRQDASITPAFRPPR